MKLVETTLPGVYVVELEPVYDERGSFARSYSDEELGSLLPHIAQASISVNAREGTLRGLHYQRAPYAEVKLVRCTRGAIFDVAVDLDTHQWFGVELTPDNHRMLLVPEGRAHGFQTLVPDTEVSYLISAHHRPEAASGARWDDPAFGIAWPREVSVISERDRSWGEHRP